MKNYSQIWRKQVNLRQVSYNEFVTYTVPKGLFLEKVDGMLGTLIYEEGEAPFFQTMGGAEIADIPALYEYEVLLKGAGVKEAKIPGELVGQIGGRILPFNESMSVVKKHYLPQNKELIFHYPVDIYSLNNKRQTIREALNFLTRNIRKSGLPHVKIPRIVLGGMEDFRKLYKEVKDKPGFDGIVARAIGGKSYKIKFTDTVDLVIIGGGKTGLPAWEKDQVSYLMTAFIDKNGLYRTSSKVGTGFTLKQRSKMFDFIRDNVLYDRDGDWFVIPKLVVEVKFFRYRLTKTPTYKFVKNRYVESGNELSITFSHPSYERLRPDKKADKTDTRLEQIPEWKY